LEAQSELQKEQNKNSGMADGVDVLGEFSHRAGPILASDETRTLIENAELTHLQQRNFCFGNLREWVDYLVPLAK